MMDIINEEKMLMNQDIRYPAIFLLGAQGVGKSTLGNMLLGSYSSYPETKISPIFPISDRDDNEKEEEIYRTTDITIKGENYSIVDTIGIPESSTSSDEIWNKLKRVEEKAKVESGIKAYIFVLEGGRLTQHGLLFIHQLFTKYPKSRTIVVFTKVRKGLTLSSTEMKKTFNTQISTLLQTINDRWIVMPSLDLFGNIEGKSVIERFVDDLKDIIMTVEDKENGGMGGKRKGGVSRGGTSQGMGLRKRAAYGGFFVVVIIIVIIIIILKGKNLL